MLRLTRALTQHVRAPRAGQGLEPYRSARPRGIIGLAISRTENDRRDARLTTLAKIQRRILTRSLGLDQTDVVALLEQIGGNTAVALSFGATTDRGRLVLPPLTNLHGVGDPAEALEWHFKDLGRRPVLVGGGVGQSLAGAGRSFSS